MAPSTRSAFISLASASLAVAQTLTFPATPLDQLSFPHPTDAPYQVYPPTGPQYVRGPQSGYNICNSTTEGQSSMCQTMYVNDLSDFCLWGPPEPNSAIGDTEGEEVAWCSKTGYGARLMNSGLLKAAQLLKTKEYIMITGSIDQTLINIQSGDAGGELDSGGQDERGNPIGGLLYSKAFATDGQPGQIEHWTEFIGSNQFCIKICNPSGSNPTGYCQHTLDRIGLGYNCPSAFTVGGSPPADGTFETCDSDLMAVPGVYVENGQTLSYSQPAETVPIGTLPYQPSLVASSNCVTSASSALFTTGAVPSATGTAAASGSAATGASGSVKPSSSPSRSGSAASSSQTGGTSGSSSNTSSSALAMTELFFPAVAAIAGVAGSIALMA